MEKHTYINKILTKIPKIHMIFSFKCKKKIYIITTNHTMDNIKNANDIYLSIYIYNGEEKKKVVAVTMIIITKVESPRVRCSMGMTTRNI